MDCVQRSSWSYGSDKVSVISAAGGDGGYEDGGYEDGGYEDGGYEDGGGYWDSAVRQSNVHEESTCREEMDFKMFTYPASENEIWKAQFVDDSFGSTYSHCNGNWVNYLNNIYGGLCLSDAVSEEMPWGDYMNVRHLHRRVE